MGDSITNRQRLRDKWITDVTSHNRPYPIDYREMIQQSVDVLTDKEIEEYLRILDTLER